MFNPSSALQYMRQYFVPASILAALSACASNPPVPDDPTTKTCRAAERVAAVQFTGWTGEVLPMGGELACSVPAPLVAFAESGIASAELQPFWDAACPAKTPVQELPAATDGAARQKLFADCGLERLGLSDGHFAYASGRPLVAAMAYAWLLAGDVPEAEAQPLAQKIAGDPVFVPPAEDGFALLSLPVAPRSPQDLRRPHVIAGGRQFYAGQQPDRVLGPIHPPTDQGFLNDRLEAVYTLPALTAADPTAPPLTSPPGHTGLLTSFALDRTTRVGTLRNLLATFADPGTAVEIVGRSGEHGLTSVPIVYATNRSTATYRLDIRHNGLNLWKDGNRIDPLDGCPKDGPTLCLQQGPYVSQLKTPLVSTSVPDLLASYQPARLAGQIEASGGDAPRVLHIDVADEFPVEFVVQTLAAIGAFAGETPPTLALAIDFAPCLSPPAGMVCVPGGPVIVGNDKGPPEERPRRELVLSTFYIDKLEITTREFDACSEAGACKRRINGHQNIMKPFVGPDQPVVPIDWPRAQAYCAFRGKRLPTEWEWEKAARGPDGEMYPWGDDEPTCDRAQYRECAPFGCTPYPGFENRWDCPVHNTKPVGTYPAGHYGIHEMAGNGYEWTSSAGVELIAECGDACNGTDPRGKCDGAFPCEDLRMLRGGSWWWPKNRIRGSHRRVEKVQTHGHRLSGRCVTTTPVLSAFPPAHMKVSRHQPPELKPLTPDQQSILAQVTPDPIEEKQICSAKVREQWAEAVKKGGRSTTECRDPYPYIMPNEPRGHVWRQFFKNLGGSYLGVGSDQNYSYIAHARSQFAWVMDYDPRVVRQHLLLRALILHSETPDEFVAKFAPENVRSSSQLLRKIFKDHPQKTLIVNGFTRNSTKLHSYFQTQRFPFRKAPEFGWLRNARNFSYIKKMYEQGRLNVLAGDLLGTKAIATVSAATEALGHPLRIYYSSNAPSAWGGEMTAAYRKNVLGMPFDARSLVLQTNNQGGFRQTGYWHHNVAWGLHVQQLLALPGYDHLSKILVGRIPTDDGDMTTLGMPDQLPPPPQ